jgi:hypothetical protein
MQQLIHFNCSDKTLQERWTDSEKMTNLCNFPAPFRMLLIGPPNCGKSTLAKNIVINQRPYFDEVYVAHADCELTKEYDDLEPDVMFSEIPSLEYWDSLPEYRSADENGNEKRIKRLLIIDDIEFTKCSKQRLQNIALLFRYISSHKGISVILGHQSFFDLPPLVKKMSDIFVLWKPRSRTELGVIENRVGLEKGHLLKLFNDYCKDPRDSICIDHIRGSPSPIRLNIWAPITL